MNQYFRTAAYTIVLGIGWLATYGAFMALREPAATIAATNSVTLTSQQRATLATRITDGTTDISVREACGTFDKDTSRARCMQVMSEPVSAPREFAGRRIRTFIASFFSLKI